MSLSRRLLSLATVALAGLAFVPGAANAGVLAASATSCDAQTMSPVFLPFADVANYTLAPGGAAEGTDGLTLAGGAAIADGNEPWQVGGGGSHNLRLPAGSSATTGALCVGLGHPDVRFFSRSSGTNLTSALQVDVLFEDAYGSVHSLTVGSVTPHSAWSPGVPLVIVANLLPLLPNDTTPVAFRLTPQGAGTWSVDDVYVDPWSNR